MRSRIPAAMRSGLVKGQQMVLVVTVLVALAPQALAQAARGQHIVVEESTQFSREYSFNKDSIASEIAKGAPENPVPDLVSLVKEKVTSVLKEVNANQNESNKKLLDFYNENSAEKRQADFNLYAAAMRDDRINDQADPDGIRSRVGSDVQQVVSRRVSQSITVFDSIRKGMNLNMDLANIFGGKAAPDSAPASEGSVKYGLIVRDIDPANNAIPQASLDSSPDQMRYAGQAHVHWGIGPVSEQSTHPFAFQPVEEAPAEESIFSNIKAPSTKIRAHVEPVADIGAGAGVLPGSKLLLTQEQGLYEFSYITKNGVVKEKSEHLFKVPLVRELSFGRRYSDNFQVMETSLYNVLVYRDAPIVNMHYLAVEDQYKAEMQVNRGNSQLGISMETPSGWRASDRILKNEGEKYRLDYNLKF